MAEHEQEYRRIGYLVLDLTEPGGPIQNTGTNLWECGGCGCAVSNRPQHDLSHRKTRSRVEAHPKRGW